MHSEIIDTTAVEVTDVPEAAPGVPLASLSPEQQYQLKLTLRNVADAEAKRQRRQQRNLKRMNK